MRHDFLKLVIPFVVLLSVGITLPGCKKDNNNSVSKAKGVYDYSYTGNLIVGDTIKFASTAPGTSNFLWKFGDGTTSTDSLPYHIYTNSDSFTVTLIINNDSTHAVQKMLHVASAYNFSYTGNLWVGDTVLFQSTAPATSTFLWTFGDGSTSTLATPVHIYDTIAYASVIPYSYLPDTVTLIINNDVAHPIKKILQIAPGIQRVSGIRTWKRIHYEGPNDSVKSTSLPDTAFAITVFSDMSISVLGNALSFNTSYTLFDSYPYYSYTSSYLTYNPVILTYAYPSDSLMLNIDNSGGALGGKNYTVYQSP